MLGHDELRLHSLQELHLRINALTGAVPDSGLQGLWLLALLSGEQNRLKGAFPEACSTMRRLGSLGLQSNLLTSSLPDSVAKLAAMQVMLLQDNLFAGPLPDGLSTMIFLDILEVDHNSLSGSIPTSVQSLRRLTLAELNSNALGGALPESLIAMQALRFLSLWRNRLTKALPHSVTRLRGLVGLQMCRNLLTGSFPEGFQDLDKLQVIDVENNNLQGTIPGCFGRMVNMQWLWLDMNRFAGTLPSSLASLQAASFETLNIEDNAFSGTLPEALCSLRKLTGLSFGRTNMEGTVPACIGSLAQLERLCLSSELHKPSLQGSLPPGLANALNLQYVLGSAQHLEGAIPAFASSLAMLVLHQNALQTLPRLHLNLNKSTVILLYQNHLSCRLPADKAGPVKISLVAVGNHFAWPTDEGQFPSWVLPFERDGLFWCQRRAGRWVILKVCMGCLGLVFALMVQVGFSRYLLITQRLRVAGGIPSQIGELTLSFFSFMASQVIGSCVLLTAVVSCDYYACPATLTLASVCLLRSSAVQVVVVAMWSRFCAEGQMSWWDAIDPGYHGLPTIRRLGWSLSVHAWLLWVGWILFVASLSGVVVLLVAMKCVPSFLPISGHWVRLLDALVGAFQGILIAVVLPYCARKVGSIGVVRRTAIVNCANMLSVGNTLSASLIPILVASYLDGACAARWTLWWAPCTQRHARQFDIDLQRAPAGLWQLSLEMVQVSRHEQVCVPKFNPRVASCVRAIALKLQALCMSKLTTAAFALPAARIVLGLHYRGAEILVMRLALLLELSMLLGASLPLLVPLICMAVFSERVLAALAFAGGTLKDSSESRPGGVRLAVKITTVCSVIFHICFVSEDASVSGPLCLIVSYIIVKEMQAA